MNITIPLAGSPDPFVESCCVAPEAPSFPFWLLPSALLILSALTISSIPILVVLCVSHGPVLTPVALAVPIVVFVSNAAPVFVAWVPFFYKFNSWYGYTIIATQFYLTFDICLISIRCTLNFFRRNGKHPFGSGSGMKLKSKSVGKPPFTSGGPNTFKSSNTFVSIISSCHAMDTAPVLKRYNQ